MAPLAAEEHPGDLTGQHCHLVFQMGALVSAHDDEALGDATEFHQQRQVSVVQPTELCTFEQQRVNDRTRKIGFFAFFLMFFHLSD